MKTTIICIILWVVIGINQVSAQEKQFTTEQWIEDLNYVVTQLKTHHPNIYYRITEDEFNNAVINAKEEINLAKTDMEAYFAIKKVVASTQDGHTQVIDNGTFGILELRFPFRLDKFSDGVFITVIRKDYEKYLGAQILEINDMPINDVLELTAAVSNADNEFGRIRPSFQSITFARNVFGLGITQSENLIKLDLITRNGNSETVQIEAVVDNSEILWPNRLNMAPTNGTYVNSATLLKENIPLHLKKQGDNIEYYWFEHLKNDKTIYFQYNQVANQSNHFETWAQFTERIWKYIIEHEDEIDKLVIDLRYNDGGRARLFMPFLNYIIRSEKLNKKGKLFVLTGKITFSASVIIMTEFAVHTEALFIGTPAAAPFNSWSNSTYIGNLPNSGCGLIVSARQNENSWSANRIYFPPDIPAPFSSEDYFSGKDPALSAALNESELKTISEFAAVSGAEAALEYYHQLKTKYGNIDWWIGLNPEVLENNINGDGYALMGRQELKGAFEVFKLNTLIFPESSNAWDSFAEWHYNEKKHEFAIEYYQKSLELNPNNENAKQMIERINVELNQFSKSDFESLNWLLGKWHGTGGGESFYEVYNLVNNSTIEIIYYDSDSTFTNSTGKGTVYYENGSIYHKYQENGVWKATFLDSTKVQFLPIKKVREQLMI